jgi:hypothetical protein
VPAKDEHSEDATPGQRLSRLGDADGNLHFNGTGDALANVIADNDGNNVLTGSLGVDGPRVPEPTGG